MTLTRQTLAPALKALDAEVARWEAADAPIVRWRTGPRKAISDSLIESFHEMFEAVATDDVSDDIKPIVLKIDAFEDALAEWAEACDLTPEDADPRGSAKLWAAFREVISSLTEYRPRKAESIETLVAQKVSDRQIAMIYGWKQEDGSPDTTKVLEEKANPGTHYDPETWVHPSEMKAKAELDARWALRMDRVDARVVAKHTQREAPETLEELIQQRVPSKQIAKMKRVDVELVRQRAAELGVPLDGQFVRRTSPADKMAELREADADREAELAQKMQPDADESGEPSLLERILELYVDGKSPQQIADELKADHPKLTYQKVSRMIQEAEQQTAQVSAD